MKNFIPFERSAKTICIYIQFIKKNGEEQDVFSVMVVKANAILHDLNHSTWFSFSFFFLGDGYR